MTLELNKVTGQIDDMGQVLAGRAERERKALPAARALLRLFAHDQERLRQVAESETGQRLRCAGPGDEPLDAALPASDPPPRLTLVAVDGSQIYPDRHGLAFYYLINVGSIVFYHGEARAPRVDTRPQLGYAEEQIYPGGEPVSSDLVSAWRGLAEVRSLADLALAEADGGPPRLALVDGPLLIWLERAAIPRELQARILDDYLSALDRLRSGGVSLAGFVSRPQSAEVVTLLYLAHLEAEQRDGLRGLHETEFRGLTDRALFGALPDGHRSALFVRGTASNRDFRARGHAICFFYLNTGADIARVEVPEWVAAHPASLGLVQAAVVDQCRLNNGYPYVLTRADEQAVILGEERQALEAMIGRAMADHGLPWPELSRKAQQKQVARWRRR